MKTLVFLISALILVSCGKSKNKSSSSGALDVSNGNVVVTPTDLSFTASRDYNPSSFNSYNDTIDVPGNYQVPSQINVVFGNSATGWLSLVIGNRKFCYQGNASNNQVANGTKFLIKWEKSNINEDCTSGNFKIPFNNSLTVAKDDVIGLSVNGGGCSSNAGTCLYTEVTVTILVVE